VQGTEVHIIKGVTNGMASKVTSKICARVDSAPRWLVICRLLKIEATLF
jgi:hypothetical protein